MLNNTVYYERDIKFNSKDEMIKALSNDVLKPVGQHASNEYVLELSEKSKHTYNSTSELSWHQDNTYEKNPYKMTALYAIDVENSGNTYWISCYDLYESLSSYHDILDGATALHALRNYKKTVDEVTSFADETTRKIVFGRKKYRHPLVVDNAYLFYNPAYVESIRDKDGNDISYMKSIIEDHIDSLEPYEWNWKKGDLIIFDNLKTIHRRDSTDGNRKLWRMCFE